MFLSLQQVFHKNADIGTYIHAHAHCYNEICHCGHLHCERLERKIATIMSTYYPAIWSSVFTARIRRMGEGNVFSLFTSGGGGAGQSADGGGGVRSSWPGGWVRSSQGGSGPAGGVRSSPGGQVQPGGGGSGPARGGGGSAKIAQHRKYLLHGGRYASCVHAGGLSCCGYLYNIYQLSIYFIIFILRISWNMDMFFSWQEERSPRPISFSLKIRVDHW